MNQLVIVGGGLAGSILAAEAHTRGIDFRWFISRDIPSASMAAYGICNPVHFKNAVVTWMADEFYENSKAFFLSWESQLNSSFIKKMPIHHLVVDMAELVQWRQHVELTTLWKYTNGDLQMGLLPFLKAGYKGSILIQDAFLVSIPDFIRNIQDQFIAHIRYEDFEQEYLKRKGELWEYKGEPADQLIFAEGVHGYQNPFFSKIPFNPCKGEILIVRIPGFPDQTAIHKKVVLLPLENDVFICGATYEWADLSFQISTKGCDELELDLKEIIGSQFTYEIIDQKAGVRPTVSDRRPVVGWHPLLPGIGILNGFGTRGLMVGPSAAKNLLDNWQHGVQILPDWDIARFKKRMLKSDL